MIEETVPLIPPIEEVIKLVPAGLAGGATFALSRTIVRVPIAAALLAGAAPVVAWWTIYIMERGLAAYPPATMSQRTFWILPVVAAVSAVTAGWNPASARDGNSPIPNRSTVQAITMFLVRAAALGGAVAIALRTFLEDGRLPMTVPWALGLVIALVQQAAIEGTRRCGGWICAGTLAFVIGHLGPVCVTYGIATNAQVAGSLGLGLGLTVGLSMIMPGGRYPPALASSAVAVAGLLAVSQHFLGVEDYKPPLAVWGLFAAALTMPALVPAIVGERLSSRTRGAVTAGAAVVLTMAAVGLALFAVPQDEQSEDEFDYSGYNIGAPK